MTKLEQYLNDGFDQLGENEQEAIAQEAVDKGCRTLTEFAELESKKEFKIWNHKNVHEELVKKKKQFGLIYSYCMEWGFGMPALFMADTMDEIRQKLQELTVSIPDTPWTTTDGKPFVMHDFHSMSFEIIKSHHIQFYA